MRAGTLIADFARGADLGSYAPSVDLGIRLHRRIDALVDASSQVSCLKPLVQAPLRRYAGILFDVFFDYALIRTWPHFHYVERAAFCAGIYASLAQTEPAMPPSVSAISARMRQYDALSSCATHEGCARTLGRIATRLKRPVDLAAGIVTLVEHEAAIVHAFSSLLPHLKQQASGYLAGSSLNTRPLELSVST